MAMALCPSLDFVWQSQPQLTESLRIEPIAD